MVNNAANFLQVDSSYCGQINNYAAFSREKQMQFGRVRDKIGMKISDLTSKLSGANGERKLVEEKLRRYKKRYNRVREMFIKNNMNLILGLVNKFGRRFEYIERGDLFLEGQVKMIDCYESWNPKKGMFSTYYGRCFLNMAKYLNKRESGKRVSQFSQVEGGESSAFFVNNLSSDDGGSLRLEMGIDVYGLLESLEDRNVLTGQEVRIVVNRYGLYGGKPQSLDYLSRREGVSKQRISQIQLSALDKIRKEIEDRRFNYFSD